MIAEDNFTSTVDGAAGYERWRAEASGDYDDDRPSASDLAEDDRPQYTCAICKGCEYENDEPPTCPGCGELSGHRGRCQ